MDDPNTFFFSEEYLASLFSTDVLDCWASSLVLCYDPECSALVDETWLNFTANPTLSQPEGPPVAILNVDMRKTDLYEEVFIVGSTRDPALYEVMNL